MNGAKTLLFAGWMRLLADRGASIKLALILLCAACLGILAGLSIAYLESPAVQSERLHCVVGEGTLECPNETRSLSDPDVHYFEVTKDGYRLGPLSRPLRPGESCSCTKDVYFFFGKWHSADNNLACEAYNVFLGLGAR